MSVTEIFTRVRSKQTAEAIDTWSEYRGLLTALANGDDVDAESSAEIVRSVGKSERELNDDVATMRKRIDYRQRYDRGPEAKSKLDVAYRERDEAQAAFDKIAKAHHTRMTELQTEITRLDAAVLSAGYAEGLLRREVIDGRLLAEERELIAERERLHDELSKVREVVDPTSPESVAQKLAANEQALVRHKADRSHPSTIESYESAIAEQRADIEHWQPKCDELRERIATINDSLREIESQKLIP